MSSGFSYKTLDVAPCDAYDVAFVSESTFFLYEKKVLIALKLINRL